MSQKLVPIYRMHQPTLISPCVLGDLCPTCARHRLCPAGHPCGGCRRGLAYQCEREAAAQPAFNVRVRVALQLVHDGLANFIHRNTALQLTFERLAHLRDQSCRVDARVIFLYAAGSYRPRVALDFGWSMPLNLAMVPMLQPDQQAHRIFCFT